MDKIQLTVDYLLRALVLLPNDNSLFEARTHIKQAVSKIEETKNKRNKRKEADKENELNRAKKWENSISSGLNKPLTSKQAKDALDTIEQMIQDESDNSN